jgi:hypothetical protein
MNNALRAMKSFYLFYHFYPFYLFYRREAATLSILSARSAIYRCAAALSSRSDRDRDRKVFGKNKKILSIFAKNMFSR